MNDSIEVDSTTSKLKVLSWVATFFRPYAGKVALAFVALIFAAGATLTLPIALRHVIDRGIFEQHAESIDRYFLILFGIVVVIAVSSAIRYYLVMWLGERIVTDIRKAVFEHVIRMDPGFFEVTRTGEVLSRITTDTTLIQVVVGSGFSIALRMMFMLIGSLVMLAITSPELTALILILVPVVILPLLLFGRRVRRLSRSAQDCIAESSALAGESLNAVQMIQAFVLESLSSQRFNNSVENAFNTACRRLKSRALLSAFAILVIFSANMTVIWLGIQLVIQGSMSVGDLSQFLLYALIVASSSAALSEVWGDVQRAAGAMERLLELLNAQPGIYIPEQPITVKNSSLKKIVFDQVSFIYPSRIDQHALHNFTLEINPGESIALVGPSGAGKSTVFQLLLRFYDLQQGKIKIGELDLAQANVGQLRENIGIVPQETIIFATDVMENIRLGKPEASDEEVLNAAIAAEADGFIRKLPEGYDSFLGERGTRLSGGQRQRIAIARVILKNSPILLLDEATSALDAESEKLVQDALEQLMKKRTTLIIAHRLATVVKANRIVVMDQGKIVAIGNHQELLAQGGIYTRLAALQFGHHP